MPSHPELEIVRLASPREETIAGLRRRLDRTRRAARSAPRAEESSSFLLVTPLGLASRHTLSRRLEDAGIEVRERRLIHDRLLALTLPYVEATSNDRLARALAYETLWERAMPRAPVECWRLHSRDDHARLARLKHEIRGSLPSITVRAGLGALEWTAHLRAFHLPDRPRIAWEAALLDAVA